MPAAETSQNGGILPFLRLLRVPYQCTKSRRSAVEVPRLACLPGRAGTRQHPHRPRRCCGYRAYWGPAAVYAAVRPGIRCLCAHSAAMQALC
jgi:hypothetical protein